MKANEPRLVHFTSRRRFDPHQIDGMHPPMRTPLWARAANWLVFLGTVLMVAGFVAFAFACAAMARWGLWPR